MTLTFQIIAHLLAVTCTDVFASTSTGNAPSTSNQAAPVSATAKTAAPPAKLSLVIASIDRERILKAAETALQQPPISITAFPAKLSLGGSNDFYSNGDYWWPDPSKPDGLPYIRRDGESNPENFSQHRMAVKAIRDSVAALAAAYKVTGEEEAKAKNNHAVAFYLQLAVYPFLADKSKWKLKPDVQAWEGWPARQPALIFAGMAFGEEDYVDLWNKLPADPTDPEVQRNTGITQPLLWIR